MHSTCIVYEIFPVEEGLMLEGGWSACLTQECWLGAWGGRVKKEMVQGSPSEE